MGKGSNLYCISEQFFGFVRTNIDFFVTRRYYDLGGPIAFGHEINYL